MTTELDILEMQILLHCDEGLFTKSDLSRIARQKYSLANKQKAIQKLVSQGLLIEKALPKLDSKRIPVFYSLTDAGKKWVTEYKNNYPKS
jgi:hypothetical protein